jgi:hypothetical protein
MILMLSKSHVLTFRLLALGFIEAGEWELPATLYNLSRWFWAKICLFQSIRVSLTFGKCFGNYPMREIVLPELQPHSHISGGNILRETKTTYWDEGSNLSIGSQVMWMIFMASEVGKFERIGGLICYWSACGFGQIGYSSNSPPGY